MPHYVIIGAGISGLALGWFLKQKHGSNLKLTILESSNRPGGWVQTSIIDDFLFEHGPRSLRPEGSGIHTLKLIEQLGLQNEVISASPNAKKRYLYMNHKLHRLPSGFLSLLTSPLNYQILKSLWKDWFTRKKSTDEEESIHQFTERRLGKEFARIFMDPLASGIYGGDIQKLSLQACFPFLHSLEQNHGGILRGILKYKQKEKSELLSHSPFIEKIRKNGLFTLKRGLQSLIDTLAQDLSKIIELESPVRKLIFHSNSTHIILQNEKTLIADRLFVAIPPYKFAELLRENYPSIASQLDPIPATSIACIHLGYRLPVLKQHGFGYLVPSSEKQRLLGVVWDSSAFPEQNLHPQQTRLTAMIGGAHFSNFCTYTSSDLTEMTLREIHLHLGIKESPSRVIVNQAYHAIPQYQVGHQRLVNAFENSLKQLFPQIAILGNGFHGISMNDCIARAGALALED